MPAGSTILRLALAIWMCIGVQVHTALDHSAAAAAPAEHVGNAFEQDSKAATTIDGRGTLCCFHTPEHRRHNSGTPHAHFDDAMFVSGSKRNVHQLDVATVPTRVAELSIRPVNTLIAQACLPSPAAPALRHVSLRAPPVA